MKLHGSRWIKALARRVLELIPARAEVRILRSKARGRRWIAGAGRHAYWLGSYEKSNRRYLERIIRPNQVVYDVGAHVGFYTLLFSRLVEPGGHVYSFEPLPTNLVYLQHHVDSNRLRNVSIVGSAVGSSDGSCWLTVVESQTAMAHVASAGEFRVEQITLDTFVSRGHPPPDFMKIDVEGAEVDVLKGSKDILEIHRPPLYLAAHGPERYADCRSLLESVGYTLSGIGSDDPDRTWEIIATPSSRSR